MVLKKKGEYLYGENHEDLRQEISRYSKQNGYEAEHFGDSQCSCKGTRFSLLLDDNEGAAVRICVSCKEEHPIGDSDEYLEDADLEECACPCGNENFEISVGVSLYRGSEDVRWLYLGCRCAKCGLSAVYGDWKNEYDNYANLLSRI